MPADHDEDALSWHDGTVDSTHLGGAREGPAAASDAPTVDRPAAGSTWLVLYGVLAGGYLLSTIGWIVAAFRDTFDSGALLFEVMYQLGQSLAIAAPSLWFGATLLLTRERAPLVRVVGLALGLALLVPWPVVLMRGAP